MLHDFIVSNINATTKTAELDQTVDETTWGHEGFGEANSGMTFCFGNTKPGKTAGGQTVLASDSR